MSVYLKWHRDGKRWVGITSRGRHIVWIEAVSDRGPKRKARLTRRNGSSEICQNIASAKDYAQELARLWNCEPYAERRP